MKKLFFLTTLFIYSTLMYAQPPKDGMKKEKIASLKVGFITNELKLTTKEAEVFWPVYNQFDNEISTLRNNFRKEIIQFKEKTSVSESEADAFITFQLNMKQQEVDILKKYIPNFKKVLPSTKVAQLLGIEQEFKLKLIKQMRHNRDEN